VDGIPEEFAGGADMVGEPVAIDHFQHLQRHRAAQRGSAVGRAVRAGAEDVAKLHPVNLPAQPERADGESTPQRLGHGDAVRDKRLGAGDSLQDPLEALEPARAEMAALDGVDE
jgi:hypothetical protein